MDHLSPFARQHQDYITSLVEEQCRQMTNRAVHGDGAPPPPPPPLQQENVNCTNQRAAPASPSAADRTGPDPMAKSTTQPSADRDNLLASRDPWPTLSLDWEGRSPSPQSAARQAPTDLANYLGHSAIVADHDASAIDVNDSAAVRHLATARSSPAEVPLTSFRPLTQASIAEPLDPFRRGPDSIDMPSKFLHGDTFDSRSFLRTDSPPLSDKWAMAEHQAKSDRQLYDSRTELHAYKSKSAELESELEHVHQACRTSQNECDRLRDELATYRSERHVGDKKWEAERAKLQRDLNRAASEIVKFQADQHNHNIEVNRLKQALSNAAQESDTLLDEQRRTMQSRIDQLQSTVSKLNKDLATSSRLDNAPRNSAEIVELRARLDAANIRLSSQSSELAHKCDRLRQAETELFRLEQQCEHLSASSSLIDPSIESEISKLKGLVNQHQIDNESLVQQNIRLQGQITKQFEENQTSLPVASSTSFAPIAPDLTSLSKQLKESQAQGLVDMQATVQAAFDSIRKESQSVSNALVVVQASVTKLSNIDEICRKQTEQQRDILTRIVGLEDRFSKLELPFSSHSHSESRSPEPSHRQVVSSSGLFPNSTSEWESHLARAVSLGVDLPPHLIAQKQQVPSKVHRTKRTASSARTPGPVASSGRIKSKPAIPTARPSKLSLTGSTSQARASQGSNIRSSTPYGAKSSSSWK